jgi:ABC-type multidrug transport system fused ATPase/permease subunit
VVPHRIDKTGLGRYTGKQQIGTVAAKRGWLDGHAILLAQPEYLTGRQSDLHVQLSEFRMDSIRITDILAMLLNDDGQPAEVTLEMLMRLYDRAHSRYLTALIMFGVITVSVMVVLIASAMQWADTKVSILALVALVFVLVAVIGLARRLNQLSRDYLDVIKVYNLLGRHMQSGKVLKVRRYRQ